jgi:hypothetical protein
MFGRLSRANSRGQLAGSSFSPARFAQQPAHPRNLPDAVIPTTIAYAARILPSEKSKFNVDLGVAQLANRIQPVLNLNARHQFALGVSYHF